ncbi:hypothetical protein GCM10022384_16220 [Streptomyces marokkonensis]|uniref:DNA primase n=1 Tax=Streptomyces marokkonensis TaxID=324855 RepID=A0ABP7PG78_9ACTN
MSDSKAAMAAAVAGGYFLGRTRKARLAFAVGSYLVGRRVGLTPGRLLSQGLAGLQQTPQLQELTDQVRGELLTAGRAAVTAAANRRLTGLADTLRDRTDALTGVGRLDDETAGRYGTYEHDYDHNHGDGNAPDDEPYFDDEDREKDREPAPAPAPAPTPSRRTAKRTSGSGGRRGGVRR